MAHWGACVKAAVERLWQAGGHLESDSRTLDRDHVALTAATLLSHRHGMDGERPGA